MNREEAIKILEYTLECVDEETPKGANEAEAIPMAIEALEGVCFDEWCDDCKEYDTEKNCCPRFNRVIRGAMKREPSEDGTLEVKVEDATKVGRVLIADDKHRGGLYYPDEDEPKGEPMKTTDYCDICKRDMCEICVADNANPYCVPSHYEIKQDEPQKSDLISRAEAIEAITETLDAIDHVPKWVFDKLTCAINILPSADRPKDGDLISRAEAIEAMGEEPLVWCYDDYEIAERSQWRADIEAIKSVPSADRPRGEWIPCEERLPSDNKAVLICDSGGNYFVGKLILTDTGYKWGIPLCTVWVDIEDGDAWMPLPEPYKGGEDE